MNVRIHRRQYLIGPRPLDTLPGWVNVELGGGIFLSHCPDLRVSQATDRDGNAWHLLGLAVQTVADRPDPVDAISGATPETIQEHYHSWTGRWLLIGEGKLHLDAGALLACYYGTRNGGDGREFWMSSSPAVLADVLGVNTRLRYKIRHAYGLDWYLLPGCGFKEIRHLFPTQILDISSGEIRPRPLLPTEPIMSSYEKTLDELQESLVTAYVNVSKVAKRLWLPLTGGKDSRTILAVLKHAGLNVRTYSHHHSELTHADRTFPRKLAKAVGMTHTIFTGGEYSAELEKMYDSHTASHCPGRDRFYFARDFFRWCRKGDILLRSHGIEIGRMGRPRFPLEEYGILEVPDAEVILEKWKERGFKYTGKDPTEYFPEAVYETLREWVTWVRQTPAQGINWRDRFTLEEGMAGWVNSIEQSLDLIDADRFHGCNCHRYIRLVLQVPEEKRHPKPMNLYDLIQRMAPELLKWPCNPPDPIPFHKRVTGKLKSLRKRLTTS
jgi:hypothetical protein